MTTLSELAHLIHSLRVEGDLTPGIELHQLGIALSKLQVTDGISELRARLLDATAHG